jgi:drug/metabolite transporter (DMT)-like permease
MTHAFQRWGAAYRPVSALGWLITCAAAAFLVQVFVAIDRQSHSVSDTFYSFYVYLGVTFLLWDWLARRLGGAKPSDRD